MRRSASQLRVLSTLQVFCSTWPRSPFGHPSNEDPIEYCINLLPFPFGRTPIELAIPFLAIPLIFSNDVDQSRTLSFPKRRRVAIAYLRPTLTDIGRCLPPKNAAPHSSIFEFSLQPSPLRRILRRMLALGRVLTILRSSPFSVSLPLLHILFFVHLRYRTLRSTYLL
jgi:hypothetical protein